MNDYNHLAMMARQARNDRYVRQYRLHDSVYKEHILEVLHAADVVEVRAARIFKVIHQTPFGLFDDSTMIDMLDLAEQLEELVVAELLEHNIFDRALQYCDAANLLYHSLKGFPEDFIDLELDKHLAYTGYLRSHVLERWRNPRTWRLRAELGCAVNREEYERAAMLRNEITRACALPGYLEAELARL